MRRFLLLISLFAGMGSVHAQSGTLRMRLVDRTGREPVAGAVVELLAQADTTRNPLYTASGGDGEVRLQQVPAGEWLLRVTSLGYKPLARPVRTSGGDEELGTLELTPDAETIEEVVLEVPALRSSIRGDTLSYRASAFKVTFGADAGALIGKMPGLEIADGVIEAQGRTVQRVFVDGREFFGSDVMSAIRNIPADMVESIDVFNSQGDQSEFTGVDIGDGYTAINIVTQPDKRRGAFGRLFAGYGLTDKYIGGGNVNIFNQSRRLSIIALANNVNIQNFSFEDILGTTDQGQAKARAGSDNFMVRPLEGISTVQAVGVNYSDDWGKRAKITASYFFNRADNRNESLTDRQTFTSTEKLVLYDAQGDSRIENTNHRFNSRFDYRFNDRHSLMMRTAFSIQDYLQQGETFSRTDNRFSEEDIRFVNRRRSFSFNDRFGYTVSNSLIYRYRLPGKLLRNLTFGVGGRYSGGDQYSLPRQYTFRDEADIEADTADCDARNISRTRREQPGYSVNGNVTYTQALSRRSRMSAEYRVTYAANSVDRRTVLFDEAAGTFSETPDPRQSTDYEYDFLTQRAGLSYQYLFRKTKVAASLYYQHVDFSGDYRLPEEARTEASYDNLTYNFIGNIHFNASNLLKINATSQTRNPPRHGPPEHRQHDQPPERLCRKPGAAARLHARSHGTVSAHERREGADLHRDTPLHGLAQHDRRFARDRHPGLRDRRRRNPPRRRQPVRASGQPRRLLEPAHDPQLRLPGPFPAQQPQPAGRRHDGTHPEHHQRHAQPAARQLLQRGADARQQHLRKHRLQDRLHGLLQHQPQLVEGPHRGQRLREPLPDGRSEPRAGAAAPPARQRRLHLLPGHHRSVPRGAADLQPAGGLQALPAAAGRGDRRGQRPLRPGRHVVPPDRDGHLHPQRHQPRSGTLLPRAVHLQPATLPAAGCRRDAPARGG